MFWAGVIIALFAGLISNNLLREKIKHRFPKYEAIHLDWILIIFLLAGVAITVHQHFQDNNKISSLQSEIHELVNKIKLDETRIEKTQSGYTVLLKFKSTKNEQLENLSFHASLSQDTNVKILDMWPTKFGSPFVFKNNSLNISKDERSADLKYNLWGNIPAIQINVSGPTAILIKGSHELEPFTINIEPEKKYPTGSEKRHVPGGTITFN